MFNESYHSAADLFFCRIITLVHAFQHEFHYIIHKMNRKTFKIMFCNCWRTFSPYKPFFVGAYHLKNQTDDIKHFFFVHLPQNRKNNTTKTNLTISLIKKKKTQKINSIHLFPRIPKCYTQQPIYTEETPKNWCYYKLLKIARFDVFKSMTGTQFLYHHHHQHKANKNFITKRVIQDSH